MTTNELVIVTNVVSHDITGLDVVNSVNGFYSGAFDKLFQLALALFALFGVALPILIQFYQKREMRIREAKLKVELLSTLEAKFNELEKAGKSVMQQEFENLKKEMARNSNDAIGTAFVFQAINYLERGMGKKAFALFAKTLAYSVKTEDLVNVQSALRFVTENALPKLTKKDFEDTAVVTEFKNTIGSAANMNANGLLDLDIEAIKKALAEAQNREPAPAK